jgi:predicted nucleotidyltransferase
MEALCRQYQVRELYVCGSAVTGECQPGISALDFLVKFAPMSPREQYQAYFGLIEALRSSCDSSVDLVEDDQIRNPFSVTNYSRHG